MAYRLCGFPSILVLGFLATVTHCHREVSQVTSPLCAGFARVFARVLRLTLLSFFLPVVPLWGSSLQRFFLVTCTLCRSVLRSCLQLDSIWSLGRSQNGAWLGSEGVYSALQVGLQ